MINLPKTSSPPSNPASDRVNIYVDADGQLVTQSNNGQTFPRAFHATNFSCCWCSTMDFRFTADQYDGTETLNGGVLLSPRAQDAISLPKDGSFSGGYWTPDAEDVGLWMMTVGLKAYMMDFDNNDNARISVRLQYTDDSTGAVEVLAAESIAWPYVGDQAIYVIMLNAMVRVHAGDEWHVDTNDTDSSWDFAVGKNNFHLAYWCGHKIGA